MLFVEFRFFWFFAIVFAVYWTLRGNRARKVWLLVCSYLFYAAWNWKFVFLLMASSLLDYVVGVMLARTENPRTRRGWLILSLTANLGTIAFFKYYNFFVASAAALLAWLGLPASVHTLNIIITVGVSFYTFHSMSYTIDVYRRRMPAVNSVLDVCCFIGFFPQMVAGPIVRAILFLPQLATARKFADVDVRGALVLFLTGFIKKACIADSVAPISDRYFANPEQFTAASAWVGVLCYTVQIYCDFSGYTDMAIATARLLGYELTINFNFPYFARNISDFWHRWHISLSSWLRDYLYIPLGGNRGPRTFVYRNIMITMVLGGLWHGGSWTFVIWGALHGVALLLHREWKRAKEKWGARAHRPQGHAPRESLLRADGFRRGAENGGRGARAPHLLELTSVMRGFSWALTVYWVCVAWIFFRAIDLRHAFTICGSFIFFRSPGGQQIGTWMLGVIALLGFVHWLNARGTFSTWWRRGPAVLFAAGYGCAVAVVLLFIPAKYAPFIYFQF